MNCHPERTATFADAQSKDLLFARSGRMPAATSGENRTATLPSPTPRLHTNSVTAIAIIPARIASTRLPRKVLRDIAGRPMLAHVYEAARACPQLQDVIVATDSEEIATVCRQNGWHYRLTSPEHRSGTDRVHEVAQTIAADVYVNVQGDEPLARREHLDVLVNLMSDERVQVGTIRTPCSSEDINNPNAVKVVTDLDGRALYFLARPSPSTVTAPVPSATSSTSASTPTASPRSTPSAPGQSRSWSATNASSSCASSTTACQSTSPRRRTTLWELILKRI